MQQAILVHSTGLIPGTATKIDYYIRARRFGLDPALRAHIERKVERLIALLDADDGDPELEFSGDEFEDADVDEDVEGDDRFDNGEHCVSFAPLGSTEDDEDDDPLEECDPLEDDDFAAAVCRWYIPMESDR